MGSNGTSKLEGALTERLKALGADKAEFLDVANAIAAIDAQEILGNRIWVRGIPAIDQVGVSSVVNAGFLNQLVAQLTALRSLRTIVIFPFGIIEPELYEVQTTFGNVPIQEPALL